VIICAICGFVFSFIGLRAVLKYEEFAWAVFFVIFMIIFGEAGKHADNKTPSELTGATLAGTCLSLIAVVYGSSASWCSIGKLRGKRFKPRRRQNSWPREMFTQDGCEECPYTFQMKRMFKNANINRGRA